MNWHNYKINVKVHVMAVDEHDAEEDIRDVLTSNFFVVDSIEFIKEEICEEQKWQKK